ncbi:cephalosporin hydroxylase [Exilibacterium tricleocarpae]|uniref:Cephalosporin hydroxylase n=1 Tax=Exilibacterium tricleocarpae TaxID=2591008 RepID=A0A545TQF8_9GAMM|nr:cephalosporin hydroxylase family protein [Exilibacterium tricleocarpae]TQV79465.1 cephalosporin hydroxylase [Exilibacterium tricleocarpae]
MSFEKEVKDRIQQNATDKKMKSDAREFMESTIAAKYSYNFSWMGRPIIQYPQDIVAMQEIIWEVNPDLIIETGIAHGGSLILYASILELLAAAGRGDGKVLGIDIDIRQHNREAIEAHPIFPRIEMIQGSSIDSLVIEQVTKHAERSKKVLVVLDSNHTHDHVLAELKAYAPLTSVGSYCVVFDTIIEDLPADSFGDRPWGRDNNPKMAVREYLASNSSFEIDYAVQNKVLMTAAPDGYLKRIK